MMVKVTLTGIPTLLKLSHIFPVPFIVDKDSVEYRNYLTMVDMVNEHYTKYGEKLNEAERVGFSGASGGLKGIRDIKAKELKFLLNQAIKNVPAYKDENYGGAVLIWGAPGIGKTTIPKAIIGEWNKNHVACCFSWGCKESDKSEQLN